MNGRRRLISFRLHDDEYQRLRDLSAQYGARSLSDFVRSCVCTMLDQDDAWDQQLGCTVKEFGQQAAGLQDLIEQMSQLIRTAQMSQKRAQ